MSRDNKENILFKIFICVYFRNTSKRIIFIEIIRFGRIPNAVERFSVIDDEYAVVRIHVSIVLTSIEIDLQSSTTVIVVQCSQRIYFVLSLFFFLFDSFKKNSVHRRSFGFDRVTDFRTHAPKLRPYMQKLS